MLAEPQAAWGTIWRPYSRARRASRPAPWTMGPLLAEVLAIMRQHHLVLPADLALLLKALAMTEGMAAQLDPSFHLMEALVPYARRLLLQQYSAHAWMTRLRKEAPDLIWLATELPHHVRQVLGELGEGTLTVRVQSAGVPSGSSPQAWSRCSAASSAARTASCSG